MAHRSPSYAAADLIERSVHRRAVETVIWGMPAVNTDLMYQAIARGVKADWKQIVYWSRLLDWKNQTLTPNPDAIFAGEGLAVGYDSGDRVSVEYQGGFPFKGGQIIKVT